ncbi:MAG: substrate-binding domain-containing protein [Defluviitaleaceae bacterium]|nr:substrate-binding domain-containing protein [Defluviitaleaceae bacterium]MCL2239598.1 substrate-binding domain-containing protein [Defluviitaleaceae bacterium]
MKKLSKILVAVLALVLVLALPTACGRDDADDTVIRIGAITSLSGALQDYGEQFQRGFRLGLEFMTDGTNMVAGRELVVTWDDTTNVAPVARERTLAMLERGVDIATGFAASGDALASLDLFEEFRTIAVIEPAASDFIIMYPNWNPYIFRTGRTSGQDALALAAVLAGQHPGGGRTVAALAPDSTFGHAMVDPFIPAVQALGFTWVESVLAPPDATDFTPFILRLRELAPDYLYVIWAGANNPWMQLMELDLAAVGTTIITGAPELAALQGMRELGAIGGFGFCVYYPTLPQNNPMNEWMKRRHMEQYGIPTDIFTSGGFAAASAIVTALEITGGDTDPDVLRAAMQGMHFDSPTGERWFRAEDHQAMQPLFAIEFTYSPTHMVPRYVRTIPAHEIIPPIMNRP